MLDRVIRAIKTWVDCANEAGVAEECILQIQTAHRLSLLG
jgi:hypothetical protein